MSLIFSPTCPLSASSSATYLDFFFFAFLNLLFRFYFTYKEVGEKPASVRRLRSPQDLLNFLQKCSNGPNNFEGTHLSSYFFQGFVAFSVLLQELLCQGHVTYKSELPLINLSRNQPNSISTLGGIQHSKKNNNKENDMYAEQQTNRRASR